MSGLGRRALLGKGALLAKGALVVAFALSHGAAAQDTDSPALPGDLAKSPLLDSWIGVDADGDITVFTGKAELGQGLKTALIQIAAHELAVAASAVDIVTADTARTPDEGVTAGSHSLQDSGTAILNAAANVRVLLAEAAAWRYAIAVDQIEMRDGAAHAPDGRTVGYGELVSGLSLHVTARPNVPRREGGSKVIGRASCRERVSKQV